MAKGFAEAPDKVGVARRIGLKILRSPVEAIRRSR
jgi:hypothetical protein